MEQTGSVPAGSTLGGGAFATPATYIADGRQFVVVPVSAIQKSRNPGYATPPTLNSNLYFGARGIGRFEASHLFDFALNYELPVWKTARPCSRRRCATPSTPSR